MTWVFNFNFLGINDFVKFETAIILLDFPKQNNVHLKNKFFPNSVPWIIVVIFTILLIFIRGITHIENSPVDNHMLNIVFKNSSSNYF